MTKNIFTFALAALFLFVAVEARAEVHTPATNAILVDVQSGAVLLDKGAGDRMPTSSMSKVMTAYMVFEALKTGQLQLDSTLPVSEKAWRKQGSKMFVEVGKNVKVEDLIRGIIIQSGNDATIVVAEGLGGTEENFARIMTDRAKELGLNSSNFANASGWPDPNHYSTARDLAVLAHRIITDFPEYYPYYSEREFTYNNIRQPNRNRLLARNMGVDGLKTGHAEEAGYGMIASAIRGDRRLILVVNGLESENQRASETARLLEWGFRGFENRKIISAGDVVDHAAVWMGKESSVALTTQDDILVSLPVARRGEVKMAVLYDGPVSAPVRQGDRIARVQIEIPGQAPFEKPLFAAADVDRKGFFSRAIARARYLITGAY